MSDNIQTISDRLSKRAIRNFDNLLERHFSNLASGIQVDGKLYLQFPKSISCVIDSSCVVDRPLDLEKNSEATIHVKVQVDAQGNLRIPVQEYFLKHCFVSAFRKAHETAVVEREHEKFIEQVNQIEYFVQNKQEEVDY